MNGQAIQTDVRARNYQSLRSKLQTPELQARFAEILGEKAQGFMASILNVVYLNDGLKKCDPDSVIISAMKAAILDLPIEPSLGFAYIIPYKDKATFQIGYKGFIQLGLRSQRYEIINVTEIYEGENIRQDRLTGQIILNEARISDLVTGYVAYFKLHDGFDKFLYMSVGEVENHAIRFSKSYAMDNTPWKTDFDAMGKKTVLKLLISKFGPMDITLRAAAKVDNQADGGAPELLTPEKAEALETLMSEDEQPGDVERDG